MSANGKYHLVRRIGWGAAGPVSLARGPQGDVAIREFQPGEGTDPKADRESFLAAGRLQMSLNDPSIVTTIEVAEDANPPFIVMMMVNAETLQAAFINRSFSPQEANLILGRTAAVLDYAHSHGVVHGDLKPSNIFILPGNEVMVGDFAISPRARRSPLPANLRHGYLSPEHFHSPMLLDGRSDQFSLAVIAYEMYTDRLPFGSRPDHLTAVMGVDATPTRVNTALPTGVDEPILRALSHDPGQRFASCMEFVSELSAHMPAKSAAQVRKMGILAGGLVAVAAIAAGIVHFAGGPVHPSPPPPCSQGVCPGATGGEGRAGVDKETKATKVARSRSTEQPRPPKKTGSSLAPPPPPMPDRTWSIEVFSRSKKIPPGSHFSINDRNLGELGHGDLKARVHLEGPPLAGNRLTIEWSVNRVVTDRQKPVSPEQLTEYDNEPAEGDYKVTVRLDGQVAGEFQFQIAQ